MALSQVLYRRVVVSLREPNGIIKLNNLFSTRTMFYLTQPPYFCRPVFHIRHHLLYNGLKYQMHPKSGHFFCRLRRSYVRLYSLRRLCMTWFPWRQLAWLPGLGFLDNFRKANHTLSPHILANIPKEVLQKEKPKKKTRHVVTKIFFALWEYVHFSLRLTRILITIVPLMAIYPIACLNVHLKHQYWRLVLFTLESLGATFIKLGQWAGTRRDLFSAEFCDMFSCLHVKTMVHSWSITKKRLRKAFGKRWREIIVRIHKKPVGSGCIAQVHKAYMRADMIPDEALVDDIMEDADDEPEVDFADGLEIVCFGSRDDCQEDYSSDINDELIALNSTTSSDIKTESDNSNPVENVSETKTTGGPTLENGEQLIPVAVKVLHPGVYFTVHRDLRILSGLVWFVEKLFPSLRWLSAQECMAEFKELLLRQIDLRMEAECLEEFNENFAEHANVRFPKPVWPYCKRSVMVETFEEGEPITNYLMKNSEKYIPEGLKEKLASFGVDALLQMIFIDNFVHGDLHPGNILVQNANDYVPQEENKLMLVDVGDTVIVNVKPTVCPVRLVLLDVGITASLSEQDKENFRNVFKAVVIGDGETVAELMLCHARYNQCKDIKAFKKELGKIVFEARKNTITLGQVQVGKLLSDVFTVLSKHRVKMESSFASVLLAIFVLEGLGRSLDPDIDILEKAKPILLG